MVVTPSADVLLETVAQTEETVQSINQTRSIGTTCHPDGTESKGIPEAQPNPGHEQGDDQPLARRTRTCLHSGAMDYDTLPGYGPVTLRNRRVRARMLGGVERGS